VAIRYSRFLHRYEFTSLMWDTANQEFLTSAENVSATILAPDPATPDGTLTGDAAFSLSLDGLPFAPVVVYQSDTAGNDTEADPFGALRVDLQEAIDTAVGEGKVLVEALGARIRLATVEKGPDVSLEILVNPLDPAATELGLSSNYARGVIETFEQTYLFYQSHDVERTVIDTQAGNDEVRADPGFKFPNVDSEWGISRGDYEQGARIAALEIRGGDGNDRLSAARRGTPSTAARVPI
jgi:hypothetical protein